MLWQNLIISLPTCTYPKFCWYATGTTHKFHLGLSYCKLSHHAQYEMRTYCVFTSKLSSLLLWYMSCRLKINLVLSSSSTQNKHLPKLSWYNSIMQNCFCLIWFFTSHQQSFSLIGLNKIYVRFLLPTYPIFLNPTLNIKMVFGEKIPKMGTFSDFVTVFFVKCYNRI